MELQYNELGIFSSIKTFHTIFDQLLGHRFDDSIFGSIVSMEIQLINYSSKSKSIEKEPQIYCTSISNDQSYHYFPIQ